MIDLIVIAAITHFCYLATRLVRAYEQDIYDREYDQRT